jgi:hypothetical protein
MIGISEYPQSLFLLFLIGRIECIIRGPKSLAGFIAYPVVPPRDIPIPKTINATGRAEIAPIPTSGAAIYNTEIIRTNVPIISEIKLFATDLIAGEVQNIASFKSGSFVASKCCL